MASKGLCYEDVMSLKENAVILREEEVRRVRKLLYPSQETSAEIKMELNKLTKQTFSNIVDKLRLVTKNNRVKQEELIKETTKACVVQHMYTALYAEMIYLLCDPGLDTIIIDSVFQSLQENDKNVKALKGMSVFFLTWTRFKKISFDSYSGNIFKLCTLSQIAFLSSIFHEDNSLLGKCPELTEKLLAFINDASIPFQYKVDLLSLKDILEKDNE